MIDEKKNIDLEINIIDREFFFNIVNTVYPDSVTKQIT